MFERVSRLRIETKYLGEIEIKKENTISFEAGLPGFEDETEFVLLDISKQVIFQILQSTKTPDLAFFVVNPYLLYEDYTIELKDSIIEALSIKNEKEVVILAVMTLKQPFSDSTINLKAPLVINLTTKQAKQYILNDEKYSMKETIPQDKIESGSSSC